MRALPTLTLASCLTALFAIAACGGGAGREARPPSPEAEPAAPWFVDVTSEAGLGFVYAVPPDNPYSMPAVMGGGVALLDADGDGGLDLLLVGAGATRLYRRGAGGRYADVSAASGLGDAGLGMGVAVGDVDNDGDVDLYLTRYGTDRLYLNDGRGVFADVTAAAGAAVEGWSASAAFCDFDRDGRLDLYVARYVDYRPEKRCSAKDGRPDFCGPESFRPVHDVVLRNLGPGRDGTVRFADVSAAAGITTTFAAGLGVVCLDADGDGWQDAYVANDADPNQLWIHRGVESAEPVAFRDESLLLGAAFNLHGQAQAGMGVLAEDLDGNGTVDLFLSHLTNEANTLYGNLGGGAGFQDVSGASGLGPASMPFTGFGVAALDVELDGDLDLFVGNGRVNVAEPVAGSSFPPPWDSLPEPNLFFLNDGGGRFSRLDEPVRALVERREISRGVASGDVDGDGDIDLVVANLMGPARLLRNDAPRRGHWLAVRAYEPALRRDALGARVTVVAGERRWVRPVATGYGYLSSHSPSTHFGLGEVTAVDRIEVRWPDGGAELFPGGPVDRSVTVRRGEGEAADG